MPGVPGDWVWIGYGQVELGYGLDMEWIGQAGELSENRTLDPLRRMNGRQGGYLAI